MERIEKQKKIKLAQLTRDAPENFVVDENDNNNNSNTENMKNKHLRKSIEATTSNENTLATSNDQQGETYEQPTQQEQ